MLLACNLEDDLIQCFKTCLQFSNEQEETVVERMVRSYCAQALSAKAAQVACPTASPCARPVHTAEIAEAGMVNIQTTKVYQRIHLWAARPAQYNHQMIHAFFACENDAGVASRARMCSIFLDATHITKAKFNQNLSNMCTEAGNSHGKVFVCTNDEVRLWSPVEPLLRENRSSFYTEA